MVLIAATGEEKFPKSISAMGTSIRHLRVLKVNPESLLQFEFHSNNNGVDTLH